MTCAPEIATALGRADDVLVIPVLVGPTSMPAAADLPTPLAALAECNAHAYHRRELGRPGGTPDESTGEGGATTAVAHLYAAARRA